MRLSVVLLLTCLAPTVTHVAAESDFDLEGRRQSHWAWQPLGDEAPPEVDDARWPRDALDRFVLARLENAGLAPNPVADKRVYIRRVTFALTGLPPTPEEIARFLADTAPDAEAQLVDRLLSSPRFGECWGQHWLDLVRFGETYGHEGDYTIPEAYRYRDYIIHAFNRDVPYNQLVTEHIAGDLVAVPRRRDDDGSNQSIQGTGFWFLAEAAHNPVDVRGDEADRVHNQIDVFSKTFLGLSMGCARCHDHKFDAISARDYYAFMGFLQSSSRQLVDVSDSRARESVYQSIETLASKHRGDLRRRFAALKRAQLGRLPDYLLASLRVSNASVERVAREQSLDADTLAAVVGHLERARKQPSDPLYAFAFASRVTKSPSGTSGGLDARESILSSWKKREARAQAQSLNLQVITSRKDGERNYIPAARAWTPDDLVADFAHPTQTWITNGMRYGRGPVPPGTIVWSETPNRPIARVVERAAAYAQPLDQAFRGFLRTQTFEITADSLWHQVRGKGTVLLVIDSFRSRIPGMNYGLHARHNIECGKDGDVTTWRWVRQNLRNYIGHRAHLEYVPDGEFAVRRALFAEKPPRPFELARPLRESLAAAQDDSPAALSRAIANTLARSVDALQSGLEGEETSGDHARLINWMIEHDGLFEPRPELESDLDDAFRDYLNRREDIEGGLPEQMQALALLDGTAEDEPVHIRGNHKTLGDVVPRRFLEVVAGPQRSGPQNGSGRLELAEKLVGGDVPLVPRVLVNRLWHHLFGRGLVGTPDDFGVMGRAPTHPRLLHFLARRFVNGGWSMKGMIRAMVLSSTYRMSSRSSEIGSQVDPTNALLQRMPIRRLPAEAIRDHILAVSGGLDCQMGGPSVRPFIPRFTRNNHSPDWNGPLDGDGRRSVYLEVRRNHILPMLLAFDRPIPFTTIGRRSVSNSPAQPLILLNDPFVHQQADIWARNFLALEGRDEAQRIRHAYLWAFGRPPEAHETEAARRFLSEQAARYESSSKQNAWKDLCHTLINVKEFTFLK